MLIYVVFLPVSLGYALYVNAENDEVLSAQFDINLYMWSDMVSLLWLALNFFIITEMRSYIMNMSIYHEQCFWHSITLVMNMIREAHHFKFNHYILPSNVEQKRPFVFHCSFLLVFLLVFSCSLLTVWLFRLLGKIQSHLKSLFLLA